MAIAPSQTQQELYDKLRAWVPGWFFENPYYQDAVWEAIAIMWERLDLDIAELEDETYICRALGKYIEEHAFERNLTRETGESDASLQDRTKNIVNQNNCPAIKNIVDSLLAVGECTILEAQPEDQPYYDRQAFYNRGELFFGENYVNYFWIIIPSQEQESNEAFLSRDMYFNRDSFYSSWPRPSKQEIYDAITAAVNKSKACGVLYFVVVSTA